MNLDLPCVLPILNIWIQYTNGICERNQYLIESIKKFQLNNKIIVIKWNYLDVWFLGTHLHFYPHISCHTAYSNLLGVCYLRPTWPLLYFQCRLLHDLHRDDIILVWSHYLHPYQLVWSWMCSWYFCHEHHPFLVTTGDDFSLLHRKVTNNTCHKLGVYDVFKRIDLCIIHLFHAARSNVIIPKIVLHSPHFHCANITVVSPHLERIVVRVLNS